MKKIFSLVLALVMALSLTTVAWGAYSGSGTGTAADPYQVTTAAELQEAVTYAGAYIKLMNNIEGDGIVIDNSVTIDLNGFSYTINGKTVGSNHTETLGMQINESAGTVVIKNGSIIGSDAATKPKSTCGVTGCTAAGHTDVDIPNNGVKMVIQNYADLTLDGVTVTGNSKAGYVVSNNCGDVVIEDTTINAAAGKVAFDVCDYSTYTGVSVTVKGNSVINGKIELSDGNTGDSDVTKLVIENGTINGAIDVATSGMTEDVTISGGTFSVAPDEDYMADGLVPVLVNGVYVTQEAPENSSNKSSTGIDTDGWKVVDFETLAAYEIAEDAQVNKIVYKNIEKTVNGKTTTYHGVTLYGPLKFEGAAAAANGGYAMVVAEESANMQIETDNGKIILARFLTKAEYEEYSAMEAQYAYTTKVASKFVKKAANPSECEDAFMSYYVVGNDYYAAATSNSDNTLIMYKNEFVLVGEKLSAAPVVPHACLTDDGTDCKWTVKNNKVVSVTCACDDTYKVVQDIKGLKTGTYAQVAYKVDADSTTEVNYVILSSSTSGLLPSGTVVVTPSTDKVQSAETFDAGIAMYVGMSVMAAAGSAVVLKKRED